MLSPLKAITAGALVLAIGGVMLMARPFDQQAIDMPGDTNGSSSLVASAGCDAPLADPGTYDGVNDFEDAGQAYRVVVPEDYTELAPAPLILWLAAGVGLLDRSFDWWSPYLQPAESVFVTVEMRGVSHRLPPTLEALIDQLGSEYCIDLQRVHAMGNSSSALTAGSLACVSSERIASIYAGMGAFRPGCTQQRPVPILAVTGDPDRGNVHRSVEMWADAYGCEAEPLVEDIGSGVTRLEYQGCTADVVLYDAEGAGHGFIRERCVGPRDDFCIENEVFDLLREAESFFAEHPLPAE